MSRPPSRFKAPGEELLGSAFIVGALGLVGLAEGIREIATGGGPLMGLLGIGLWPALVALVSGFVLFFIPSTNHNGRIWVTGFTLLALAGALAGHDIERPARAALAAGLLSILYALFSSDVAANRRRGTVIPGGHETANFVLLLGVAVMAGLAPSPALFLVRAAPLLVLLHFGLDGILAVAASTRTWWARMTADAAPRPAPVTAEPSAAPSAEPVGPPPVRELPDPEVRRDIEDFLLANYAEKWPEPEVTAVMDAPAFRTYVIPKPETIAAASVYNKAEDLAIKLGLQGKDLRIAPGGRSRGLLIQIRKKNEDRQILWYTKMMAEHGPGIADQPYVSVIGENEFGEPMFLDLADRSLPHLLIAGRSGSGKTVLIHTILVQLLSKVPPSELQLAFLDPKRVTGGLYEDVPHLWDAVVTDLRDAPQLLRSIYDEQNRREGMMQEVKLTNINDFNDEFPDRKLPILLVVVDEAQDLGDATDPKVKQAYDEYVGAIARKGRSAGVLLILGVQRPTQKNIGEFRGNLAKRIVLALTDKNESALALQTDNDPSATALAGRGDGFLIDDTGRHRFNGAFLPDVSKTDPGETTKGYLARIAERYAGQSKLSARRAAETASATVRDALRDEHSRKISDFDWLVIKAIWSLFEGQSDPYHPENIRPAALVPIVRSLVPDGYGNLEPELTALTINESIAKTYGQAASKAGLWPFNRWLVEERLVKQWSARRDKEGGVKPSTVERVLNTPSRDP